LGFLPTAGLRRAGSVEHPVAALPQAVLEDLLEALARLRGFVAPAAEASGRGADRGARAGVPTAAPIAAPAAAPSSPPMSTALPVCSSEPPDACVAIWRHCASSVPRRAALGSV
jgi:hypothetical protein